MIKKIRKIIRHAVIITKFNSQTESKPTFQIMFDLFRWTITNRGHIINFFILGLYQKDKKLSEFLNFKSFKSFYKDFYPPSYLCLLEDKLVFEKFINNFPEYAPKTIGYVTKTHFFLSDALPHPIETIVEHPMNCIVKHSWGFGGKDIFLLRIASGEIYINGKKSTLKELLEKIPERSILQEILEQHEVLKKLHPASINTLRVISVNTGTEVKIVSSFLRMGVGGNFVDNISKGNMYIPIDKSTGKFTKYAYSVNEPIYHLSHPETHVVFDGIQIPYFNDAMEMVKKLHRHLPYFFVLGWDVAFTPTGPVVIESNNVHIVVHEQVWEGGLKKQFDEYQKEFMGKNKTKRISYS